jgi:hypothetical protein
MGSTIKSYRQMTHLEDGKVWAVPGEEKDGGVSAEATLLLHDLLELLVIGWPGHIRLSMDTCDLHVN